MLAMRSAVVGVSQGAVMRVVVNCMIATCMSARSRSDRTHDPACSNKVGCMYYGRCCLVISLWCEGELDP